MMQEFENPFADYGGIVHGDRFIGRQESLSVIENRLIQPRDPANLAIIGQPRSGKSSLVYQALIERKEQLIEKNLIPIWVNLATYDQSETFFQSLVDECMEELEDLDGINEGIQRAAARTHDNRLIWNERYRKIQRFFKKVRESGYRVLLILDEFDNARYLFKDSISDFQKLRELSYQPDLGIALITTSRRSIKTIELQTGDISTLSGIFQHHYLGMFDDKELQIFFNRLVSAGVKVSEELKNDVLSYCGGYPYLLDMLGCEIIEMREKKQDINVEKAVDPIATSLFGHYHQIVDLLKEDGSLDGLLQILFGPVIDAGEENRSEFLGYGLIRETDDGDRRIHMGFSEHFHVFLQSIERRTRGGEVWSIWSNTEKALRQCITTTMSDKYGGLWTEELEKAHPNIKKAGIFERCRNSLQKAERGYDNRDPQNPLDLLDFTYPQDLFAIIFAEWNIFKDTFGRDKPYWDQRAQLLSKTRNPFAHNYADKCLQLYERQIFEGYCNEILTMLNDPSE